MRQAQQVHLGSDWPTGNNLQHQSATHRAARQVNTPNFKGGFERYRLLCDY